MKFREHRGSLADSMLTAIDVDGIDGLLAHLKTLVYHWPTMPPITEHTVHIEPYGFDDRIRWNSHIVTLDGYGVLGFTDSAPSNGDKHG